MKLSLAAPDSWALLPIVLSFPCRSQKLLLYLPPPTVHVLQGTNVEEKEIVFLLLMLLWDTIPPLCQKKKKNTVELHYNMYFQINHPIPLFVELINHSPVILLHSLKNLTFAHHLSLHHSSWSSFFVVAVDFNPAEEGPNDLNLGITWLASLLPLTHLLLYFESLQWGFLFPPLQWYCSC